MQSVRINKDKLIETIKENREAHVAEYLEVIDGYWEALQAQYNEHAEAVQNHRDHMEDLGDKALMQWDKGPNAYPRGGLPKPELHVEDYDEVLEMLEMSEDDTIELDREAFSNYVRDDWGWKGSFELSASNYKKR